MAQFLSQISIEAWAIIVTIVVAILSLVVGIFREDIREIFRGENPNAYLLGSWHTSSNGESETRVPSPKRSTFSQTMSTVIVTSIKGNQVTAEEEGGCDRYKFSGEITPFHITLQYKSDEPPHQRNGVLILARRGQNSLVGRWVEVAGNGALHWGEVTWSRPTGVYSHLQNNKASRY